MRNLVLSALTFSLVATQSLALSCVSPEVAESYNAASESDQFYHVVNGRFTPNQAIDEDTRKTQTIEAQFSGKLLTTNGFDQDIEMPVQLELLCLSIWCGRIDPNVDYLAFVEERDDQMVFTIDPCYRFAYANPSPADLQQVIDCAQDGPCTPSN